ncbi:MAG: hypothetical protein HY791_11120 [Deltaproteobacteria bacterium]|nr:hypothetical protein [Deltaproteobacteria bacterium]
MARCALIVLTLVCGCVDSDAPGPIVEAADPEASCSTASVFPRLLSLVRSGRLAPLREVIESRLMPTESNPRPDPSLRSLLGAGVTLVRALGLEQVLDSAEVARRTALIDKLQPLAVPMLRFVSGAIDGATHYEAAEATARFVDRCDPDHLLSAVVAVSRLESRSHPGRLWLDVVIDAGTELLEEPMLRSAIEAFQNEGSSGRPAIVSLVGQTMTFLDDDDFDIERVRVLYQDAVVPAVDPLLASRIGGLIDLLEEATDPESGVFLSLKGAFRCGNQHPEDRDAIVEFLVELVLSETLDLDGLLAATTALVSDDEARALFDTIARVIESVRTDPKSRDQLRGMLFVMLSRPAVEDVTPVGIDVLESRVADELIASLPVLLEGCSP